MRALRRDVPLVHADRPLREALRTVLDQDLPALPVVDGDGRYVGVFGEREFLEAVFPGYLKTLKYAAFVKEGLDEALEPDVACLDQPLGHHVNTEHVDLPPGAGDTALAETFLHHRVLIVPIVDDGRVVGVVRRSDFFRTLAESVLGR